MQLIKDGKIIENKWTHLADDMAIHNGNITISVSRWLAEKEQLQDHQGDLGLRIDTNENIEDISGDLEKFKLIELNFPAFTDGRAFSHARLLRNKYQYKDEIRAVGKFMTDQVFYLSRVGVNAFNLNDPKDIPIAISTLQDFSVKYQVSTH
jgi:uncharacterized protein (DUF934 family)